MSKWKEMLRSLMYWADTGDNDHLLDIWRIAVWKDRGDELLNE